MTVEFALFLCLNGIALNAAALVLWWRTYKLEKAWRRNLHEIDFLTRKVQELERAATGRIEVNTLPEQDR